MPGLSFCSVLMSIRFSTLVSGLYSRSDRCYRFVLPAVEQNHDRRRLVLCGAKQNTSRAEEKEMKTKLAAAISIIVGLLMIAVISCGGSSANPAQAELDRHRTLWEANRSGDYTFEYRPVCFCPQEFVQPVRVEVRNGIIDSVTYIESGESPATDALFLYYTIDGLFDKIQDAMDREAARLTVSYDPDVGYPTSVSIDYALNVADEEFSFTATSYELSDSGTAVPRPTATPLPPVVATPEIPGWLSGFIQSLENQPVDDPPAFIAQYDYKGQAVYFLPQRCCDIFSVLYDVDGNIIGHPHGEITGRGDGRVPDFLEERTNERIIWKDKRAYDPGMVQALAPIESVEVLVLESFPQQYMLGVVSGLPNGCASFAGYRLERQGDTIGVEIFNWKPADEDIACTEEYRTVETNISLGSDFVSGTTYTASVNDVVEIFVAQ